MTQPSRTREYLYPEEPVQIEISSKQGVKPEVWWSEFRRNGERGPHAVEASVETAAGIKQKVLSRYKTKSMKIDQGRKVDICLRFSPDMPMIADKDFALGLLLVACDPRDPYLYSVTVSICERALPMDGGPAFTLNALKSASIGDSAQSLKANVSVVTSRDRRWWRSDFTCRPFLSSEISLEFIVIGEREVSNAQWKYMNRPQSSVLRLLENAEQTGDVIIVGKEDLRMPAHAAVLAEVPYFQKLLHQDCAKKIFDLSSKLEVQLPCDVSQEAVGHFLRHVYGDPQALKTVDPTAAPLLQDIIALADACGVPTLIDPAVRMTSVTEENVDSWLDWLLKEHGVDVEAIRRQVVQLQRTIFLKSLKWDTLTSEQLCMLRGVRQTLQGECKEPEQLEGPADLSSVDPAATK